MAKVKKAPVLVECCLGDAASEAFGELQSLAEEMGSWRDGLEEKFSHTEKYERVSSAADALEQLSEPEVPEELTDIKVEFVRLPQRRRGYSRADRCGQAVYVLDTCVQALQEYVDDDKNKDKVDEAQNLIDELERLKDEAEGVEFPGMYG